MDKSIHDIDLQIATYLSGNSTLAQKEALLHWKNLSEENNKTFEAAVKVWENSPGLFMENQREQDKMAVKSAIIAQSVMVHNRDRLLLKFLRFAAVLIGPIMLAIGWYAGNYTHNASPIAWNTVTAPRKHIAVCTMSDGTEIWLNAGSSISYPSSEPADKREVKLSGEGYFKVTKNAQKPFFVITPEATVKVLGTSFNMKAYPGEERIVTTLEEGSIVFFTRKSGSSSIELHPGEQAVYDLKSSETKIKNVDAARFSAWRSEKFLFKDADLKTILAELERLYDIKIHIKNPALEKLRFRGMFSYDQDLLDAFETLKHSVKLNYTIKDREVWLE
jgi:transmembrane sensor